jgi:hypothetical protein
VPASASAASTSISGPSAADYAKQACTASEAPNRYAIANHTSPPPSALSDALKEATALAAKAAQIDAGWKDLLDAFDQWYTDTFLGQAVDNAKLQPVLHTVTVECLRSGYQYGS